MKPALLLLLCGALFLPAPAGAQAPAAAPTTTTVPEEKGPPKQEVVSGGTLPDDLLGRWLVVGWIALKDGEHGKTTTSLWDVTKEDEQVVFREVFKNVPAHDERRDHRGQRRGQHLQADGGGHRDAAARVGLAPRARPVAGDATERDLRQGRLRPRLQERGPDEGRDLGARARPARSGAARTRGQVDQRLRGDGGARRRVGRQLHHATIAAAPFPIPIKLEGKFQMYRLGGPSEAPKKGGFWSSLFSGCGRK
jgi:hypothetical protein